MTEKLKVLDLFSGIGGFSLGLERTGGFETVAFCEIEPFPRRVLAKHWPKVPCYDDVRTLTADTLARDGIAVDVICGGFPCQDLSRAGSRAGIQGSRSGLWKQFSRLIGEIRPKFVIVENVPDLLSLGLGTILGDLASLRYDAIWECIPASAVGAAHLRDRFWLIAHPQHPDAYDAGPHPEEINLSGKVEFLHEQKRFVGPLGAHVSDAYGQGELQSKGSQRNEWGWPSHSHRWDAEPDVGRVAYGIPNGVDRIAALGNAVVPKIPELIGRAILQARAA
jgi:DNA (cytosine-5)-methyltransferase 1